MNRQARALLTILIVGAILIPYWLLSRAGDPAPATATPAAGDPLPQRGGAIVASSRTDPRSFNRLTHPQIATEMYALLTQARLVRLNRATWEAEPWLAESWTTSADGLTDTLRLRDGLMWSDGVPFTSADVQFTFEALYDPRAGSPLASAIRVDGQPLKIGAPDARTVVITYPAVFTGGIRLLDSVPMLPRHKLAAALEAGTFGKAWAAGTPPSELVSLGPFQLTEYLPGQRMVFARNPHFWRRDARGVQLPYADRVTIELVPDQDAEVVRLQAGQTDFMQQALRPSDLAALRPLEAQGRLRIEEVGVALDADALIFNLRPERWQRDPRGPWLGRTEFRQALSHAIDREAFANTVFLGEAVPVHGPVTPGNREWFWPDLPRYEFSRDKARALLAGLGLQNRDGDEWLEDARGEDVRFTMLAFRGNAVIERSAAVLRDDLRQIGVAVDVVPLEPGAAFMRVLSGDFDAMLASFAATDVDPSMSKDFWLSGGGAHFWHLGQKTPATAWEAEIDRLMQQLGRSGDRAERKRLFNDVQRLFAANLPILYFAAPRVYLGTSTRVTNLQPALVTPQLLWSVDTLAVTAAGASQ